MEKLRKKSKFHLPVWAYAAILVGIFLLFTITAQVTGHWKIIFLKRNTISL